MVYLDFIVFIHSNTQELSMCYIYAKEWNIEDLKEITVFIPGNKN